MVKKLSIVFIIMGLSIVILNGYQWWTESRVASFDPELEEERSLSSSSLNQAAGVENKKVNHLSAETITDYQTGEHVGELVIPRLGKRYPVFYGADQATLKKGVGMYDTPFTTSPSEGGHTALAGHRETTFVGLDALVEGDFIYVTEGVTEYKYQINNIWVTDSEDTSVIVSKSKPTLTLTTCYPFDFIGSAPKRFIVQADLVNSRKVE
ncbi:sortase [Halobacillus litoralis]|uniref:sortase n=1 Tax=Halobacillus litoralis TaxID=45668 RepID=UPI001CFD84A1|nr:sortase [Halobacillus litoralis]